tara:strand:+ start:496 stop:945 length:450 start_codon:yes stop_codon:yes gene_type:complete
LSNYKTLVDVIIKDESKGTPCHEHILTLGETPDFLIEHAGFPNLKLVIKASTIVKACFDHGMPPSLLKRLPDVIGSPKSLYKSATHSEDSVVVLTLERKGRSDAPIIIPIHREKRVGRGQYNLVASIYAKEGPDPEDKWGKQGLLLHQF